MNKKTDSKGLSLATVSILGQAPSLADDNAMLLFCNITCRKTPTNYTKQMLQLYDNLIEDVIIYLLYKFK